LLCFSLLGCWPVATAWAFNFQVPKLPKGLEWLRCVLSSFPGDGYQIFRY
jgi:hypothetical protein